MKEKYNINQTTLKIIAQYSDNYQKSMHLRELARAVKIDAKAVGIQLKRLEASNLLLSKMKGRNLEYTLNMGNLTMRYYLIMAEVMRAITFVENKFIIKKIMSEFGGQLDGAVILFGSFAKGRETKDSDVDILFLAEKEADKNLLARIDAEIGREVNVKSMRVKAFTEGLNNGDALIMEIVKDHIILKGADRICDILWNYYGRRSGYLL